MPVVITVDQARRRVQDFLTCGEKSPYAFSGLRESIEHASARGETEITRTFPAESFSSDQVDCIVHSFAKDGFVVSAMISKNGSHEITISWR